MADAASTEFTVRVGISQFLGEFADVMDDPDTPDECPAIHISFPTGGRRETVVATLRRMAEEVSPA